uniref:Uncharacterized protein n=1 Tax=Rhizophora mucronata TaxID=61149 RepID=A0A2P2J483_RHIMU
MQPTDQISTAVE